MHSQSGHDVGLKSCSARLSEGISMGENDAIEPGTIMDMLTRLDRDLAYSTEKLVNLELYVVMLSIGENKLVELSKQKIISDAELEDTLIFDLSFGYLDSEVTELRRFLNVLQKNLADARRKIYSCRQGRGVYNALHEKLLGSERSWKHLQEKLSDMQQQLVNLHRILTISGLSGKNHELDENLEGSGFDLRTNEQQKLVLRILEKSIAEQLDLEKELVKSKAREEELSRKLICKNDIICDLEAFTEVSLERVLEAEHSSGVYMGIAKELISRLEVLQFHLHCSVQKEEELKSKFQSCLQQLKDKEIAMIEIERNYTKVSQSCQGRETLDEKVKLLEEKLQSSESKLEEANSSYKASQDRLSLMEHTVDSLKNNVFMAETQAHDAETRINTLTEENIELREEVVFLKGCDNNEEKITMLERKVRELETQLQTAKTQSEASLEQQNMLYTAIWDMETLIEELKSKFSKTETRAENAEAQCLVLTEANLELNKEIGILKSNTDNLEENLKESNRANVAWVKDINNGAKLVTNIVKQLEDERERIQKQLSSLSRENKILLEELWKMRNGSKTMQAKKEENGNDFSFVMDKPPSSLSRDGCAAEETGDTPVSTTESNQVDEPLEQSLTDDAEAAGSIISDDSTADIEFGNNEHQGEEQRACLYKPSYIFAAIFVMLLSVIAMNFNWQDISSSLRHQFLGL